MELGKDTTAGRLEPLSPEALPGCSCPHLSQEGNQKAGHVGHWNPGFGPQQAKEEDLSFLHFSTFLTPFLIPLTICTLALDILQLHSSSVAIFSFTLSGDGLAVAVGF